MKVGIIGGSGYIGGELLRILLHHPNIEVSAVVSRRHVGEYVFRAQPNLRKQTQLKFVPLDIQNLKKSCDLVFTATPHGSAVDLVPKLLDAGLTVIDMSADYRLKNPLDYERWYGWKHNHPDLLKESVYGLPELHREEIKTARLVACPGCMSTLTILSLAPVVKSGVIESDKVVVDTKIGSSGGGTTPTPASHHPERFGGVRAYSVFGHRHIAEIEQELNLLADEPIRTSFTAHAVNMVRGILATIHVFLKKGLAVPDVWRLFRSFYQKEPFIRIVRDSRGLYRLPNPNVVIGSNYCDIGFELDDHVNRMVIISALDNLMKGAAGQGVQCLNILLEIDERMGLGTYGFHPM